ncbi:hypothetical protein [Bacillus sp. FJAT-52991]|uniref:Uncharacterized protein n=1 Tax=Bacillus kandeliae TaxID=3129297 RepID=A0ABZ2N7H0_9BACI
MDNPKEIRRKYNQKWGFGMAPLKSKMEYEYKKAVYSVYKILTGIVSANEMDLDDISKLKGLINRCLRQDQWDWFTVYAKFGEPNPQILKSIPHFLTKLRRAVKK